MSGLWGQGRVEMSGAVVMILMAATCLSCGSTSSFPSTSALGLRGIPAGPSCPPAAKAAVKTSRRLVFRLREWRARQVHALSSPSRTLLSWHSYSYPGLKDAPAGGGADLAGEEDASEDGVVDGEACEPYEGTSVDVEDVSDELLDTLTRGPRPSRNPTHPLSFEQPPLTAVFPHHARHRLTIMTAYADTPLRLPSSDRKRQRHLSPPRRRDAARDRGPPEGGR